MIIQFKDREKELSELSDVLSSRRFEFIILYGRRRIGKTELILKATENRGRIYYLAVGARNLDRFHSLCARHYPEVSKLRTDWEVLFEFLENKAEVVVIDEFQNMIHEDANILNVFQSIIDITLKDSELKLFLLGSSGLKQSLSSILKDFFRRQEPENLLKFTVLQTGFRFI